MRTKKGLVVIVRCARVAMYNAVVRDDAARWIFVNVVAD